MLNSETKLSCLIGSPVSHSLSPFIYRHLSELTGQNFCCLAFDIPANRLESMIPAMKTFGVFGANVTSPHKKSIIQFLDLSDKTVDITGSCNCIANKDSVFTGYNTDIDGICGTLNINNIDVKNKKTIVYGAGGAAASAAYALSQLGASEVVIANRSLYNAERLTAALNRHCNAKLKAAGLDDLPEASKAQLIVNCTTVGLNRGDESIVNDFSIFPLVEFAFDLNYHPPDTAFVSAAKAAGIKAANGSAHLVFQAAKSFFIWTGIEIGISEISVLIDKINDQ